MARLDGVVAATLEAFNFGGFDPHARVVAAADHPWASHGGDWPHMQLA